jgi:hypothetical protein
MKKVFDQQKDLNVFGHELPQALQNSLVSFTINTIKLTQEMVEGTISGMLRRMTANKRNALLKKMITERVEMTDKAITAVHVTDDPALYKAINELNDMLDDTNASFETLQTKALDIAAKLTGNGLTQPQSTSGANQQSAT